MGLGALLIVGLMAGVAYLAFRDHDGVVRM